MEFTVTVLLNTVRFLHLVLHLVFWTERVLETASVTRVSVSTGLVNDINSF